ncbi:Septin-4, partial [Goodea atripinnis]
MLDPPHHGGHSPNHQHGHEAHDAVEEIEGQDRPLTPSHLQPPVACRAQSDSGSDTSLSQSRSVEFELPSPISPSRPRSPWALWKSVADYIDQQFEQYFRDESGLNRKNIQDNRVHCCLYFISPFGHGYEKVLRPLDVEFMKALHEKVNIVPILAKADTLTPSEIREEIEQYGIKIYQFPDCDSDEDEEFKQQDHELKESIPFAVIGSNTVVEAKGKRVRGRLYPWGIVEVENSAHCDFIKLRNMLVRTHMQDLKDVTRETHYENYRAQCIQSMTRMVVKERNRNKLTRESGTDFPIPMIPGASESETEKLIREKDEE